MALAQALQNSGRRAEALDLWRELAGENPDDSRHRFNYGFALYEL